VNDDTIRVVLLTIVGMTALSTLSFPILFARYNWRKTAIGRALMIMSSSTALALTVTFLMALFRPPAEVRLIVYLICFGAIGISSARLTWTMVHINNADRVIQRRQKDEVSK
jgi:FlaA1/EpsC-like NDP-sugar epimerase